MAAERSRRANAGSNIARLIEEDEKHDEFYQTAYGGFEEVAVDEEYEVSEHVVQISHGVFMHAHCLCF